MEEEGVKPAPWITMWNGDGFDVLRRQKERADKELVVGARYVLEAYEERSAASHAHYFATLTEMWMNAPHDVTDRFPTVEHFRRYCLIRTGWRDEQTFVCSSKAEAVRVAAFLKPIDEFAVVSVNGAAIVRWTAKSQAYRAMNKAEFARSKDDVLSFAENLIKGEVAA
jgi:hypothetical protein